MTELGTTGLDYGTGNGQVTVAATPAATVDSYAVTAKSKNGHTFTITKSSDGTSARSCKTGGKGGCPSNEKW